MYLVKQTLQDNNVEVQFSSGVSPAEFRTSCEAEVLSGREVTGQKGYLERKVPVYRER